MKLPKTLLIAALLVLLPYAVQAATRSLTVGTQGSDVLALQKTLAAKGYLSATPNGYFGPATLAAVKKFQCDRGVVCSGSSYGIVGPKTQAVLAALGTIDPETGGTIAPLSSRVLTGQNAGPAWSGPLEVGGWIPYWRSATGTQDVLPHLSQMTEVSPFVLTMKTDGTLNDAGPLDQAPWPAFIAAAKAQHVRVIPTVMWGDGATEQAILSNTNTRIALEDQITAFVKQGGYNGIDIDFEAKEAQTMDYFSTFLKGLYSRMGNKWVYCSIEARMPITDRYGYDTAPPPDATEYANDFTAINNSCDRVEVMAYDQGSIDVVLNQARAAPYVPVADPAWVENVIKLAAQTISPKKLLIGIPTYGYEYSVTPLSQGYRYDVQWAFNPGYAVQLAAQLGIQPVRNSADELSFIYKPSAQTEAATALAAIPGSVDTTTIAANTTAPPNAVYSQSQIAGTIQPPFNIVWWSDAKAISDKVALAKKLGVRGVAIFKLDGGEDQGIWNVLPGGSQYVQ
jgi:spore germination protein YaaH